MWGRASAGAIAGFFLSAGLVGLGSWVLPGPWQSTLVAGILVFFALWMLVATGAFFFRSGRAAWGWLGGGAVASLGLLWTLQHFALVH